MKYGDVVMRVAEKMLLVCVRCVVGFGSASV